MAVKLLNQSFKILDVHIKAFFPEYSTFYFQTFSFWPSSLILNSPKSSDAELNLMLQCQLTSCIFPSQAGNLFSSG